ncbi:MAG: DUF3862 domain-containing protein [Algicola sp.]|nr:DUF3862 domain-containing protein [Algicola sp.]
MKIKSLLAVITMSVALVGCSKVNKENYEKLTVGMEYNKVTEVVGDPDNCKETLGTKRCTWGDDSKNIKVSFIADKAILFSNSGI